jgi:hypothetical protein
LTQKASTELKMAQPANAAVTVQRADELRKSLEDPYLAARIATIRAHVMLATGRLGEVEKSLSALDALALPEAAQDSQELTIQWRMARGDGAQAGMLAQQMPDATHAVHGSLALAAVQAALRNHDLKTARAWMARWPGSKETDMPWELVRALGTYAGGDRAQALQIARRTNVMSERNGVANERIQAGVLLAMLLLEQGQPGKATAILGDLDAFSTTDYRVAWTTLALYRALGDADMTANALARVQALRGERDTTLEPAL